MSQRRRANHDCPASTAALRQQMHEELDEIADWCEHNNERFFAFETQLKLLLWPLARLCVSLYLLSRHQRLEKQGQDYPGYRRHTDLFARTLRTMFGGVVYLRSYWFCRTGGGGFHPLDVELGLTRDGFSPGVMSLACRLSAYLSFAKTTLLLRAFWGWSPSTETVEQWVLGLGRETSAYMASPPRREPDGDVLVIEIDGKAVPTATTAELAKRRGPRRHKPGCGCGCQRHRGRTKRGWLKRNCQNRKKRRKRGDKSKNGKSATLVAMYTLVLGADGKLHGPKNKLVWGSFASRRQMMKWARAAATARGFGPETTRLIQIVMDGEKCFAQRLRKLFPRALLTLDIFHVEERLWKAGRAFHAEGSDELVAWVEELQKVLYQRGGKALVRRVRALREQLADDDPATKGKRAALDGLLRYLEPRTKMMRYPKLRKLDLVISTGVIEGAVRYVIGERMDCSGMRWIKEKAEAILHLRCIEVNGHWDDFFDWCQERWREPLENKDRVQIRTDQPLKLPKAA